MNGFWGAGFWSAGFWRAGFWGGPRDREVITAPGGGGTGRFAELVPAKQEPVDLEKLYRRRREDEALILALLELA